MTALVRTSFFATLLLSSLAACASAPKGGPAPDAGAPADDDKVEELEHKLAMARMRLEVAELEGAIQAQRREEKQRQAAAELALSEARLAQFLEADRPTRLGDAELSLRTARDRAQEAADELAQIEIMYADQDLDDLTAEFVVARGRRQAERAAARIALQEARYASLRDRELPQEEQRLQLALDRSRTALEDLGRDAELASTRHEIELREKRKEVERLEKELAELSGAES